MPINTKYHLLANLLSTLEADGFVLGTGKQLQVQELLRKLPDDLELESLKTILCPIFATSRQEQDRFYELFDHSLRRVRAMEELRKQPKVKVKKDVELWRNIILALFVILAGWAGYILELGLFQWWQNPTYLLVLLLAAGAIYFSMDGIRRWRSRILYIGLLVAVVAGGQLLKRVTVTMPEPVTNYVLFSIEPGSTTTLPIPLEDDELITVMLCNQQRADTSAVLGSYFVDSLGNLTIIAKDSFNLAFQDSICVLATYRFIKDTTFFITKYELPKEREEPEEEVAEPEFALLDTMPIPFPRDIVELQIDAEQQRKAEFYQRNAWWIKLLLTILFGAILWSLIQWRERKRKRLVAELEQRDKPPYIWDIRSNQGEDLIFGDSARIVLNQLRRRRLDDTYRLDLRKTVEATVKSAGRIDFQFKQQTIPPDYLLLIDRHGFGDHRAELFDHLYDAFRENEVNVDRFFYNGDPRTCFNEEYSSGINIKELQHRFGEARLLIVGNAYELLSPATGQLSKWASIFTNWRERALFTPQPIGKWGRREQYLGEHFYLMPASVQSLGMTLEEFGSNEPRSPQELITRIEDAQWRPIEMDGDIISTLRKYYSEPMVQWIAACAVYPALQWDLTVFLGEELSPPNSESLLTIENLLQLTQLPWFIEGKIPDVAREELIEYLAQQGLETRIRERLQWLLTHAPQPSTDSVAYDDFQINKTANEWHITDNRRRRRELEEELTSYYAAGHNIDVVVFKKLDRERRRIDFEAPAGWKDYFYKDGDPFFGMRDWVWALPLWAILTIGIMLFSPKYEVCRGERQFYAGLEICLTRPADYLLYYEYLIRDKIEQQNLAAADSLLNYARNYHYTTGVMSVNESATADTPLLDAFSSTNVDTTTFLRNLAVVYYNTGVKFYNQRILFNDSTRLLQQQEEALPQNEFEYEATLTERLQKYQGWKIVADSLAEISCTNFRRGSQLFTNATKGVGYDFLLAMQKICLESPTSEPIEEVFTGRVVDATDRPLARVTVKALNGNISTQTNNAGNYELKLPTEMRDSLIKVEFTVNGYASKTENLPVQDPLRTVTLDRLQPKVEGVEVFEAKNGYKGLRTTSGTEILPAQYDQIDLDPTSGWYRLVRITKESIQMGYVNNQGQIMIPLEYRALGFLKDGMIVAAKESYGYLDSKGNIAISFIYEGASDFSKGEAEVSQRLYGQRFTFIINKEGRCIRSCPPGDNVKAKTPEQVISMDNIKPFPLYFAPDQPEPTSQTGQTDQTYEDLFAKLFTSKSRYYPEKPRQKIQTPSREQEYVDLFFSREVQGGFNQFNDALTSIEYYLENTDGKIEITLNGYTMLTGLTNAYSRLLAARRISAVKNSILDFNGFAKYFASGRLQIKENPVEEPLDNKLRAQLESSSTNSVQVLQQNKVEVVIRFAN